MASWKKVIVSGSTAELAGLTLSGDLTVSGGDITLGSTSIFSGGDTTSLNNIDALDATTEATIEAAIDTLSNLTAASSLATVGTLNSGAISSGFGNIDNGTEKSITFSNLEDSIFANVSGDATIAAGGALTIANGSVENDMLAGSIANAKLANSAITIAGDSVSLGGSITAAAIVDELGVFSGSAQVDHDSTTNFVANEHIDHTSVTLTAGNGLTGGGDISSNRSFAVGAGTGVTVNANDVAIGQDVATSANVTFATVTTTGDVTIAGDLSVQGTQTSVNTANLLVEDRFILANSGSATGDGGLIVQTESAYSGSAFAWDDSEGRWGFQIGTKLGQNATAVVPDAYVSSVVTSDDSTYQKNGNIRVQGGEIYIYVE